MIHRILLICLLLTSCTTLGTAFNQYHQVWDYVVRPTKQSVDILITVRVRGFGSQDEKQANFPWGNVTAGAMVPTSPPQLWVDVGEDENGMIMIPPHIIGHELIHALQMRDKRIMDPDEFRGMW